MDSWSAKIEAEAWGHFAKIIKKTT